MVTPIQIFAERQALDFRKPKKCAHFNRCLSTRKSCSCIICYLLSVGALLILRVWKKLREALVGGGHREVFGDFMHENCQGGSSIAGGPESNYVPPEMIQAFMEEQDVDLISEQCNIRRSKKVGNGAVVRLRLVGDDAATVRQSRLRMVRA